MITFLLTIAIMIYVLPLLLWWILDELSGDAAERAKLRRKEYEAEVRRYARETRARKYWDAYHAAVDRGEIELPPFRY